MKTFILIYHDEIPYLRQRNPLYGTNLVSEKVYAEHESLYLESALVYLGPFSARIEYAEDELSVCWQFFEADNWIDVTEPNFIATDKAQYRQVFRLRDYEKMSFQENVGFWVLQTFGEDVANDIPERCFRFIEEAIELVQAFGVTKEDVFRHVTRTYGRPQGEIAQEVGGTLVTLAALCQAANLSLQQCGETELSNNWKRQDAIREKWLQKTAITP